MALMLALERAGSWESVSAQRSEAVLGLRMAEERGEGIVSKG